jgi:hypothetical protein
VDTPMPSTTMPSTTTTTMPANDMAVTTERPARADRN